MDIKHYLLNNQYRKAARKLVKAHKFVSLELFYNHTATNK